MHQLMFLTQLHKICFALHLVCSIIIKHEQPSIKLIFQLSIYMQSCLHIV